MSDLIELVFEDVAKNDVANFLISLLAGAKEIDRIECSEDKFFGKKLIVSEEMFSSLVEADCDLTTVFNVEELMLGETVLHEVLIRLVKYGGSYDVDLNFDPRSLVGGSKSAVLVQLHQYAKFIRSNFSLATFYCGLEPASDEDTRYFTDDEVGPLKR